MLATDRQIFTDVELDPAIWTAIGAAATPTQHLFDLAFIALSATIITTVLWGLLTASRKTHRPPVVIAALATALVCLGLVCVLTYPGAHRGRDAQAAIALNAATSAYITHYAHGRVLLLDDLDITGHRIEFTATTHTTGGTPQRCTLLGPAHHPPTLICHSST